ncbi:MAG: hypothetical protein MJE77_20375 [Proteobacteria bacterium]|nr:hypothetical protein [Pseudomonadota bacterium]
MSDRPVTQRDLDRVEGKLDERIDRVESKLEIVAQQVARLTRDMATRADLAALREELTRDMATRADLAALREELARVTRADLAALREELGRDIARHIEAGFTMMRDQFGLQDDRATAIEHNTAKLRADFTMHTRDFVLHNKP